MALLVAQQEIIPGHIDALIQAIYRGPLETQLWQSFLNLIRDAVGGNYATLLLRPPREGDAGVVLNALLASHAVYSAYNDTYFALDPFVDLPSGDVATLQEYVPSQQMVDSDYYQHYLKPIDVFHIMGADLRDTDGMLTRLRITRPRSASDFGASEKALIRALLPHLQIAITLHNRIKHTETERAIFEDAIDHLEVGTIILDEHARVLRTNQAAQTLLAARAELRIVDGRLNVGGREDNIAFRQLVEEVMDAHRRSIPGCVRAFRVQRDSSRAPLGLLIRPLPMPDAPDGGATPSVAIFISDPERRREAPVHVLRELFEFTPAEAALALLLANGLTLDEASDELGITRNTAKSHLSSIFSKTGVTRQPKLVQLILKSVAPIG